MSTHDERAALSELALEARALWPGIEIDDATFAAYALERADDLEGLRPDLYLACALAGGSESALAVFEAEFLPRLGDGLRRGGLDPALVDDALAILRFRLLVDTDNKPAKIRTFRGRSSLHRWLAVVATREARSIAERERKRPLSDVDVAERVGVEAGDLESQYFAASHRAAFRASLERAIAELSSKERLLLRLDVLEALSDREIALIYQVHRTTALRWVEAATNKLIRATKRHLGEQLGIRGRDLDSLLRGVVSHLDLSLGRLLAETPRPKPSRQ